jgi:hypothetical protein
MVSLRRIFRLPLGDDLSHGSPPGDTECADGTSPLGDERPSQFRGMKGLFSRFYFNLIYGPEGEPLSPFGVMKRLFLGFHFALLYGLGGVLLLVLIDSPKMGTDFFYAYTTSYRTIISLGVVSGTAIIVYYSQHMIPQTVRRAFGEVPLPKKYYEMEKMFLSRSLELPAAFVVFSWAIFSLYCQFKLPPHAQRLMVIAVCMEYGLAVYVGRKLLDAALMLETLMKTTVPRNLFRDRELDNINTFVHISSTLMIIFFYLHVTGYYHGDYSFNGILGLGIKPFLLLLAVVSTPVLLMFNFFGRALLRRLYSQSIDIEIKQLQQTLSGEGLTYFEQQSYVMEVEKMSRDELRYSLQLSLSDLPIGITILVMIIQTLLTSATTAAATTVAH